MRQTHQHGAKLARFAPTRHRHPRPRWGTIRCMQAADGPTDETLMMHYAQGQASAFNTLYGRHETGVWRYIFRSVQNPATADELAQELWFSVARAAPTYEAGRNGAKFKTWLFTMAHHRIVDHWRAYKPHESIDIDDDETTQLRAQLIADSGFGPLRQIESREQARALIAAVEALPAEQRDVFLMQAEGSMSVEDIAQAAGCSFETAKSRLRYARNKLKTLLAEFTEANV
jgi:RNA polymerase sigma factor (sigma-70 family)